MKTQDMLDQLEDLVAEAVDADLVVVPMLDQDADFEYDRGETLNPTGESFFVQFIDGTTSKTVSEFREHLQDLGSYPAVRLTLHTSYKPDQQAIIVWMQP